MRRIFQHPEGRLDWVVAALPAGMPMDGLGSGAEPVAAAETGELINSLCEPYTIVVTHCVQQAVRVAQRTAYLHPGRRARPN